MGSVFTPLDLVIFVGSLVVVMAVGLIAGRKEETKEDFFLAGRTTRWWGVAGSIFGSNVSANHIVGMMAVGFTWGLAESHFEIGAIAGLMMLCYFFLPVYRKLNVYTLSEYLSRRYDDRSRLLYAVIMVLIMVVVQMVPGFYIGSRAINVLLQDGSGDIIQSHYVWGIVAMAVITGLYTIIGGLKAVIWTDFLQSILMLAAGLTVAIATFSQPEIGGWGGLKEIDQRAKQSAGLAIQSDHFEKGMGLSLSNAGVNHLDDVAEALREGSDLPVTIVRFAPDEKWSEGKSSEQIKSESNQIDAARHRLISAKLDRMDVDVAKDQVRIGADPRRKMGLYQSADNPDLPWTGVLTGLMVLHFFYWGTNQFIVQRALSARDDREARLGIIAAGFFKLLIPFMSIGTGIAAFYLFQERMPNEPIDQDATFPMLMKTVVKPIMPGLIGLIAAGLIGAILSSIDSMMNSAATIFTFDIYKRYVNPQANDMQLIAVGRGSIVVAVVFAATMAIFTMDPNSKGSFFMTVAKYQSKLIPGVLVAFAMGIFWKRATAYCACAAIISGTGAALAHEPLYAYYAESMPDVVAIFGTQLNFMHSVFLAAIISAVVHVTVSLATTPDEKKSQLTWAELGEHEPGALRQIFGMIAITLALFACFGWAMVHDQISNYGAAILAAAITLGLFLRAIAQSRAKTKNQNSPFLADDRFWAGLLCAVAVFMMFYFY